MSQLNDEMIQQSEPTDPAADPNAAPEPTETTPTQTEPVQPPVQQGGQRQQTRAEPPPFVPSERIRRARERADKLDGHLGAQGELSGLIDDIAGAEEETARENFHLRQQLQQTNETMQAVATWQAHDLNPENKSYPSSQAAADYREILSRVNADPELSNATPDYRKALADGEFRALLRQKRTAPAASPANPNPTNHTAPPAPAPAPTPTRQATTRILPRGTLQSPPVPPKPVLISDVVAGSARFAPETEAALEAEFKAITGQR